MDLLLAAAIEEVVALGVPGVQSRVVGGHDVAVMLLVAHVVKDARCTQTLPHVASDTRHRHTHVASDTCHTRTHEHTHTYTDAHTNRQGDRQTDRLTDKQTGRETNRQTDKQAGRQTDGQKGRQTDR